LQALISLKNNNVNISFNDELPAKIYFQLEYFNLKKKSIDEKKIFVADIAFLEIEKIINFLKKKKIKYNLDENIKRYLQQNEIEKNDFQKKTTLISQIKKDNKEDELKIFGSKINFLKRSLKNHQLKSLFHLYTAGSAANFSVPGSGKTSVVLAYFEKLRLENKVDALFVIGPKNSFGSWEVEYFNNFNVEAKLEILGKRNTRKLFYEKVLTSNLILAHFATVTNDVEYLKSFFKRNRILLVVDEAHYFKKIDGVWANAILEFSIYTKYKIVLTGTPIPNDLRDIYNYLDFLFGQNKIISPEDKSRIEILLDKEKRNEAIQLLRDNIFPYFIRITKNDLNLSEQLFKPPTIIEMNPIEKKIYETIVNKIKDYGDKFFADNADLIEQICKARIIRLKQCASYVKNLETIVGEATPVNDENLITDDISQWISNYDQLEKPAKLIKLVEMVNKLKSQNKKVLIWSTHLKTIDLIFNELLSKGVNIEKIIGETDLDERKNIKLEFNDKNSSLDAIIATPQSCSESISLHKACTNAIYYDQSYNAAEFLQSLDRIHRVGGSEDQSVEYDFLQYKNTVDLKVYNKVFQKANRQMQIIEEDNLTFDLNEEDENWETLYRDLSL
jgi:SNF2 family DNA or RNA helicase|tara:strand:+ start:2800 stop:4647 length:1848 start_codon:yes stop_codon:yes gene_type:complete